MRDAPECELKIGSVRIVAAPDDTPPFSVGALVVEEDTFRLLGDYPPRDVREGYGRLIREMAAQEPAPVGSVRIGRGRPMRILAIVHDLDQQPSCREAWVTRALDCVFREVDRKAVTALALPFLGTRYQALSPERFLLLVQRSLEHRALRHLKRVWLILPDGVACDLLTRFSHRAS